MAHQASQPIRGWIPVGVALVSAAGLLLQVALTRVFSVVQWYHFAFMAVGLGLLGFGASGTALAVLPSLRQDPRRTAAWSAAAALPAVGVAILALWAVPFDAYRLALEPLRQSVYVALQLGALVMPFFAIGLCIGAILAAAPEAAGRLYGASFLGSGAGAIAAVPLVAALGGPGTLLAAAALSAAGGAVLSVGAPAGRGRRRRLTRAAVLAGVTVLALAVPLLARVELPISPYKTLSQLRRLPDAQVLYSRWNAVSRVDVVRSTAVRSAPGMSYAYLGAPPALPGMMIDGEGLRVLPATTDTEFTAYLPTAIAYRLHPGRALIIGLGVEVLGAIHHRMRTVTVVEANPLVVDAARRFSSGVLAQAAGAAVTIVAENPRTYLRRTRERFAVIQMPPLESFQVVASGAFSLTEHYTYTIEGVGDSLRRLEPGGVLVMSRWAQVPPSEEVRVWAAAVAALEAMARDPRAGLVALRSLNTVTMLVKPDGFSAAEIAAIRAFAVSRRFDIPYGPGVAAAESNRFNVQPQDLHRQALLAMLDPARRATFLSEYGFQVGAIRDDRPFFFHFFRWRQLPQILAAWGRTWQPFGGGGYLVLVVLLAVVTLLSAVLILAPLRSLPPRRAAAVPASGGRQVTRRAGRGPVVAYFLALGLAYLFIEIPLLQQTILVLGNPTYALAVILAGLLVSSGAGSLLVPRFVRTWPRAMLMAAGLAILIAWGLPSLVEAMLGMPRPGRLGVLALILLPLGGLMGMPFPAGIRALGRTAPHLIPWAWGINGCASVLASILAVMLALEWGFRAALVVAGIAYMAAWLSARLAGWVSTGAPGARRARTPGS